MLADESPGGSSGLSARQELQNRINVKVAGGIDDCYTLPQEPLSQELPNIPTFAVADS